MAFQLSNSADKNKVFIAKWSELEGRLDPDYIRYLRKSHSFVYPTAPLGKILRSHPQYGANEQGIQRNDSTQPRYIRITDIDEFGVLSHELGATATIIEDKYILVDGDLLLARSGNTVGKAYLHTPKDYLCFFAGYLIRFKINNDIALPSYVFTITQLSIYKEWVQAVQRSAGQPNINAEEYRNYKIPLPPIDIQSQIVAKINAAYAKKKQKGAQAQLLLDSIDSYLLNELGIVLPPEEDSTTSQRMFIRKISEVTGGRIDPFFHIPYLVKLDNLFISAAGALLRHYANSYASGATPSKDESDIHYTTSDKGIPFIRVQNLSITGELQLTDLVYITEDTHNGLLKRSKVFEGNLLVKITGVGRMALASVAPDGFEGNINQHVVVIRTGSKEVSRWLATFINLNSVEKIASKRATGGTRPALDYPALFSLPIVTPPSKKQKEIAAHIQAIRDQAKQLRAEAAAGLEQAKQEVEAMILGKDAAI